MGKRSRAKVEQRSRKHKGDQPSPAPETAPANPRRAWLEFLLGAVLLAVVTCVVYAPALHGPFIFDDDPKIVLNDDIKDWDNIWSKLVYPYDEKKAFTRNDPSRPVVYLTFAWNYHVNKLDPYGYRLFNVIVHMLNALLIWGLVRTLWWYAFKRRTNLFPCLAALFYAVHPLNTSTVSYIFSRSDILSLFFYLLAMLLFAVAFRAGKWKYPALIGSMLCFIPSFYAKQLAATLPAVILLFDFVFLSEFRAGEMKKRLWAHLPYWGLLAAFLIGRVLYFGALGDLEAKTPLPAGPYFLTQAYAIARYLQMALIPTGMSVDHAVGVAVSFWEPKIFLSWLLMLGIVAALAAAIRKRTDASKLVVFFIGFFIITIAPTSSFLPTTAVLVDNRMYLPGLAWVGMFVLGYDLWAGRGATWSLPARAIPVAVAALHLIVIGAMAANRNTIFKTEMSVWQDVAKTYPENGRAHTILAGLYHEQGDDDRAIEEYLLTAKINPLRPNVHNNLASIYYSRRQVDKAIEEYKKEIEIRYSGGKLLDDFPPADVAMVHKNLANALYANQNLEEAVEQYTKAIELHDGYTEAYVELGTLNLLEYKNYDEAARLYARALELDPHQPMTHNNLGVVYLKSQQYEKALNHFQAAVDEDPKYANAFENLVRVYTALEQPDKAAEAEAMLTKLREEERPATP